jgi:flagellar biosynthesis/type III secretory pathway M-ring protein FliF/YscJ
VINLESPEGIDAPVRKDQVLGTVEVYYDHELIGRSDLLAISEVERSAAEQVIHQTNSFFHSALWKWILFILIILLIIIAVIYLLRIYRVREARRRRAEKYKRDQVRQKLREELDDQ